MKKLTSLFLCLALLLSCAAALGETAEAAEEVTAATEEAAPAAEEAAPAAASLEEMTVDGKFTVKWICPEGYTASEVYSDGEGYLVLALTPDEAQTEKPMMMVSISPNELYADVNRLNDLDEAALTEVENTFREEDMVEISYMETSHGTKLMVVKESNDGTDYVDFYTIYLGHEMELVLVQQEAMAGTAITEEQTATVIRFLSDMEFEPVK